MLVDIGRDNGLGLDVDEVLAAVRLEVNGKIGIRIHVPQTLSENSEAAIEGAPASIAGALHMRLILGQLDRYVAMEAGVRRGGGCSRVEIEIDGGETTNVFVAHAFTLHHGILGIEEDQREGLRR